MALLNTLVVSVISRKRVPCNGNRVFKDFNCFIMIMQVISVSVSKYLGLPV